MERGRKKWLCLCGLCALLLAQQAGHAGASAPADATSTAAVLASDAVLLLRPNLLPSQAMAVGNGSLGIAAWSADGLTIQLNRADTMPYRLSPGQVTLPFLQRLTSAPDYAAHLDLYNGEFVESGGGMTARIYVEPDVDTLVVSVTGAPAAEVVTAELRLWPPRRPKATLAARYGALAESWVDNTDPGASGRPFGSLAAISGTGGDLHVAVKDARTVALTLRPYARGAFTVRVAAPAYDGTRPVAAAIAGTLTPEDVSVHRAWWHSFWGRAHLIQARSPDGLAQYMANLRNLYLFYAAAERGTAWPGSQAGIADLLSAVNDNHMWDPAAFWHWNLRMMTAANLRAGVPDLNASYFSLYRNNLEPIESWTRQHMERRAGICVPETMRFNGPGIEYERWDKPVAAYNCAADSPPYYNARTLSTGAEVSLWIWQQYLVTDDIAFLRQNYPVMRESARFLLAYQKRGPDGLMHTSPSNAHETQWDVTDPLTDLAGLQTLYANTAHAAALLHEDAALRKQLSAALLKLPAFPRTAGGEALPPSADASGTDVLAASFLPAAAQHNVENIGLEPVWPYGLIGADGPEGALAKRTFRARPYPMNQDWSSDPIQAARLGLAPEVSSTLAALTEHYQVYLNGLASWGGHSGEFYIEQSGVVADALSEALVQDYDGTIRIAPAVPAGWSMAGSVAIRHRSAVDVRVEDGVPQSVAIHCGARQQLRVRPPWGTAAWTITDAASGRVLRSGTGTLTFPGRAGHTYRLQPARAEAAPFAWLAAEARTQPRHLGSRTIGLDAR